MRVPDRINDPLRNLLAFGPSTPPLDALVQRRPTLRLRIGFIADAQELRNRVFGDSNFAKYAHFLILLCLTL